MNSKIPDGLKPGGAGVELWQWLDSQFENLAGVGPLAMEICRIADRLQEVRGKIDQQGLSVSGVKGRTAKNPLVDTEIKLSGQFQKLWRSLGLSDKQPEEQGRFL